MVWAKGQELQGGRLVIERILEESGFGITYKAMHRGFNAPVLIKTPKEQLKFDPNYHEYVKRFIREARILKQLAADPHPHIVRVYDLFEEDNTHCLVVEFIVGKSLFELVQQQGALPEAQALKYIGQIGDALKVLHAAKLIHRDATPLNIILSDPETAVLIDFGISGEIVPITISSTGLCNPAFAPYEQFRDKKDLKQDQPTVDIYTISASLYYAVTGRYPTDCLSRKVDDEQLVPPKQLLPSLSNAVNEAILAGMELKPENRPQSMGEWLRLLEKEKDIEEEIPPRYERLRDLLATQNWKEADMETARVMLQVAGRQKEGWLDTESIEKFPGEDLRTIDQLWLKYSNGRFGFSVQKRIYQNFGGTKEYNREIWESFGDYVGWRVKQEWVWYDNLTFDFSAPEGHLPSEGVLEIGGCRYLLLRRDL